MLAWEPHNPDGILQKLHVAPNESIEHMFGGGECREECVYFDFLKG